MHEPKRSTRREFLSTGASTIGGGWLALRLPWLAALSACARDAALNGEPFTTLSAAEAAAMRAFAAQVFPTDETPGADEAGVVYFVDRGLGSYFAGMRPLMGDGLRDLDDRARAAGTTSFDEAPPERQLEIMREVETTPFFGTARLLAVLGMFSDPLHGGNRAGAGWTLLGMEHEASYQPPFGYYDAEAGQGGAA